MNSFVFAAFFVCLMASFTLAQTRPSSEILQENNITYAQPNGVALQLDLARPAGDGPYPAIVFIHGGGWSGGHRQDFSQAIRAAAQDGFVCVTITYRLAPTYPFPAQLEDCKAAVRWLRANAKTYHIDPDRIGAVGHSAGGHLAAMLGLTAGRAEFEGNGGHAGESSAVQAVACWSAPTGLMDTSPAAQAFLAPMLGVPADQVVEAARRASPLTYVSKSAPPFLLIHGGKDGLVPVAQSERLRDALKTAGVHVDLIVYPDDGHMYSTMDIIDAFAKTGAFFKQALHVPAAR